MWLNVCILKLYNKYDMIFLYRSLDMVSTFINVYIVIERCICLRKIRVYKRKSELKFLICLFFFVVISSILFLPNSFFFDITERKKNESEKIVYVFEESFISKIKILRTVKVVSQYTISVVSIRKL